MSKEKLGASKKKQNGGKPTAKFKAGGKVKSSVNKAGNYTKPGLRKRLFEKIKASSTHGTKAGQWSARKAQLLAQKYEAAGGGYKDRDESSTEIA